MAVIGNLSSNGDLVSKHIERDDFITHHIDQPLYVGRTNYYTGLTSDEYGTLTKHIQCSGEAWEGLHRCINFNLKNKVLEHFLRYSMKYYTQYDCNNYPSGSFFSC